MDFNTWFSQLISDEIWYSPASMHHRPETFKSIANRVYMDCVATGFKPIGECRRHVYNIVCKTPGDNKKVNWREATMPKEAKELLVYTKEHSDKCAEEALRIIKESKIINHYPRMSHKQQVEEGDWLPKKPAPYPQTTPEEAYIRARHLAYIKQAFEPRTGQKLPGALDEAEFNLQYDNDML